jgi:hypothetical protein
LGKSDQVTDSAVVLKPKQDGKTPFSYEEENQLPVVMPILGAFKEVFGQDVPFPFLPDENEYGITGAILPDEQYSRRAQISIPKTTALVKKLTITKLSGMIEKALSDVSPDRSYNFRVYPNSRDIHVEVSTYASPGPVVSAFCAELSGYLESVKAEKKLLFRPLRGSPLSSAADCISPPSRPGMARPP